MHTVITHTKEYQFETRAEAESFLYSSTDRHKLALLCDEYGLVVLIQKDYGCFQSVKVL